MTSPDERSVTVAIAAFNCETFIARAIDSAATQTLSPLEILVVDDCSTDGTRNVVAAAAESDSRIRVIALPRNGGPSAARNAAIDEARGCWIAVLDADDAFAPERLAELVAFGTSTGADMVVDDVAFYDAGAGRVTGRGLGEGVALPHGSVSLRDYFSHNLATGTSFDWGLLKPMFRREAVIKAQVRYQEALRHGEDFQFVTELLIQGADFRVLNKALYLYTQRFGAVSNRSSGMTRTAIGYGSLRDATMACMRRPEIAGDPDLVGLLHQRATGLGRLDDAHFVSTATRAFDVGAIASRIRRDPSFLPFMLRQVGQAVSRRLSRA